MGTDPGIITGLSEERWRAVAHAVYDAYWAAYGPEPVDAFESLPEYIQKAWIAAAQRALVASAAQQVRGGVK